MDKCGGGGGGGERGEDPYEEQLLAVFESCDREGRGLLDGEGLSQLCQMLHLEERRDELVSKLIGPTKLPTLVNDITFPKFREALLAILATPSDTRESSPVREVSPKFVYGQKKYGRRSRPESTDHDFQDLTIEEAEAETFIVEIQDSHRNGKISPERIIELETPEKVDAGNINDDYTEDDNNTVNRKLIFEKDNEIEGGAGEAELRSAWSQLDCGSDGYLHRGELAKICAAVGMDTLADQVVAQVFSKLSTDQEGRIQFEEFLELFRSRMESPPLVARSPLPPIQLAQFQQPVSPDSFAKSGMASDLWENGSGNMNISKLFQELQSVRSILESVTEERDKLRSDLADANYRAAVLAQEVDEHHTRIEKATQNKVRLLELKHAEELKEVKCQAACDREQLVAANQKLEHEIAVHIDQLSKVGSQLATLRKEFEALERENRLLGERLRESEISSQALHKQLECMDAIHQRLLELESAEECTSGLRERLTVLQSENTELRDRNDELTTQLEVLQTAVNSRQPQRREGSWEISGGGGGMKRRGTKSPPLGEWGTGCGGARFAGKVRRCCTENDLTTSATSLSAVPLNSGGSMRQQNSESGLESDFDTLAGTSPTPSNSSVENGNIGDSEQEIERLRAYVSQLETKLDQYQMMKEWDLSKANNANASDDDSSFQYLQSATLKSEVTQVTKTSISNASDLMSCISLENDRRCIDSDIQAQEETHRKYQESLNSSLIITSGLSVDDAEKMNQFSRENMARMLSVYQSCSSENCSNFRQAVMNFFKTQVPDKHNFSGQFEGSTLEDVKNSHLENSFPFKDIDLFESMETYKKILGDGTPNKVTKFDKLSQFAFEFIDTSQGPTFNSSEDGERNEDKLQILEVLEQTSKETNVESEKLVQNASAQHAVLVELEHLNEENADLKQRCSDLETSLELMRVEYEKTEDYWSNKLDEERKLFELDQQQSDEKFIELELKIQEYAEMLSNEQGRKHNQLLPPIEERDYLEKQFMDLEEEYESYRHSVESELAQKDSDIAHLEQALAAATRTFRNSLSESRTIEVQTDNYQMSFKDEHSSTIRNNNIRSSSASTFIRPVEQYDGGINKRVVGRGVCRCWCHEWERREVSRMHELRSRLRAEYNTHNLQKPRLVCQLGAIRALPQQISYREGGMIEALNIKLREQESKCKQLQSTLRHHHRHTQRLVNKAWERCKSDLVCIEGALRVTQDKLERQSALTKRQFEKLAAADVLVKNLFVKNSRLELALVRLQENQRSTVDNGSNNNNSTSHINNNYEDNSLGLCFSTSIPPVSAIRQFNSF